MVSTLLLSFGGVFSLGCLSFFGCFSVGMANTVQALPVFSSAGGEDNPVPLKIRADGIPFLKQLHEGVDISRAKNAADS